MNMLKILDKNDNAYITNDFNCSLYEKMFLRFFEKTSLENIYVKTEHIKYFGTFNSVINELKRILKLDSKDFREYYLYGSRYTMCGIKDGYDFYIGISQRDTDLDYDVSYPKDLELKDDRNFTIELYSDKHVCDLFNVEEVRKNLLCDYKFINWIYISNRQKYTKNIKISKAFDVKDSYYPFLKNGVDDYIKKFMDSNSTILVMNGVAGTGKTSFIRHMILNYNVEATLTYDKSLLESDDFFLEFLTNNENPDKIGVLIFEDADDIITSRKKTENNLISKLLNISDGIFKNPNKKIVFTTNITEVSDIDPALIRVGRCHDVINFRKLTLDECNVIVPENDTYKRTYIAKHNGATISELFNGLDYVETTKYADKVGFI